MATLQQIVAYIKQHMGKYPIASLRAQLIKQRVPPATVDQAIRMVQGQAPGAKPAQPGPGQPQQRPGQPAQRPGQPAQRPGQPAQRPPGQPAPAQPQQKPPGQPAPGRATPPAQPAPGQGTPPAQRPPGQKPPGQATPPAQPAPGQATPPAQPAPGQAAPPAQPKPEFTGPVSKPPPGRTYILVVDDDPLIRDMLVAKLESAGYRVTCAEDAAQSVIQAEGMRLSIIISDIEMPGFGTGVDALRKLRTSSFVRKNMPVIFVTGMPPQEARKVVPKTDPYVRLMHKPVDWQLMQQYIRELTGMDKSLM